VLLSRPPLTPTRRSAPVRLACFRHAASVYPEPGSNSPSELSGTILPYRTNGFLTISHWIVSSPHHSSLVKVPCFARSGSESATARTLRQTPNLTGSEPLSQGRGKGKGLAATDCPTQLPTQYRWRWGVSRPCSGRERVGPPRWRHQDQTTPLPSEPSAHGGLVQTKQAPGRR
jgi:hypothetical protein